MAIGSFKDLTRITAAGKAFYDKTFNIAKNLKYDGYQLASMVYKLLDQKNLLAVVLKMRISQTSNYRKNYTNQLLDLKKVTVTFHKEYFECRSSRYAINKYV